MLIHNQKVLLKQNAKISLNYSKILLKAKQNAKNSLWVCYAMLCIRFTGTVFFSLLQLLSQQSAITDFFKTNEIQANEEALSPLNSCDPVPRIAKDTKQNACLCNPFKSALAENLSKTSITGEEIRKKMKSRKRKYHKIIYASMTKSDVSSKNSKIHKQGEPSDNKAELICSSLGDHFSDPAVKIHVSTSEDIQHLSSINPPNVNVLPASPTFSPHKTALKCYSPIFEKSLSPATLDSLFSTFTDSDPSSVKNIASSKRKILFPEGLSTSSFSNDLLMDGISLSDILDESTSFSELGCSRTTPYSTLSRYLVLEKVSQMSGSLEKYSN